MEFIERADARVRDQVVKAMRTNYSYLLEAGAIFLNLRPKWRRFSLFQLILYFITMIYFIITLAITTIKLSDDVSASSQSIHFAALAIIVICILISYTIKRDKLIDLMTIVETDYYQYSDSFKSAELEKWKKNLQRMKLIVIIVIPIYFLVVISLILVIGPWVDELQGYKPKDFVNGVYMKVPIPMWFPYPIENYTVHLLTLITELIGAFVLSTVIVGADLVLIFQSQEVNFQMRVLRDSIKHIEERAAELYQQRFKQSDSANKNSKNYTEVLNFCIKENVEHHETICRAFRCLYALANWPFGGVLLISSALIALSLFNLVAADKLRIATQLFSLMVVILEIGNILLICYIGQQMLDVTHGVSLELYDINWMEYSRKVNTSVLIMKEYLKRDMVLKAGGISAVNLEMFTVIINTAYSYFSLLLASSHDKSA